MRVAALPLFRLQPAALDHSASLCRCKPVKHALQRVKLLQQLPMRAAAPNALHIPSVPLQLHALRSIIADGEGVTGADSASSAAVELKPSDSLYCAVRSWQPVLRSSRAIATWRSHTD